MDPLTGLEEDEAFFRSGEALAHDSEPSRMRSLAPVELESASRLVTPEQLARAARFRKPVAMIVGGLGLMSLLALATHRQQGVESLGSALDHAREPAVAPIVAPTRPLPVASTAEVVAVPSVEPEPLAPVTPPEATEPVAASPASAPSSSVPSARSSALSFAKRTGTALSESRAPLSPSESSVAAPLPVLPSSARFPDLPR